jgi:hypothetical protein
MMNKNLLKIVALALIISMSFGAGFVLSTGTGTTTITPNGITTYSPITNASYVLTYPISSASYIVFMDNTNTYVRNGTTGDIEYYNPDASASINWAIQNLPSAGGEIYLKTGDYVINSPINLYHEKVALVGAGVGNAILDVNVSNINCVVINASSTTVSSLSVWHGLVTATGSGAGVLIRNVCQDVTVSNIHFSQCYYGVYVTGKDAGNDYPVVVHLQNLYLTATVYVPIKIDAGSDIYLSQICAYNAPSAQCFTGLWISASAGNTTSGIWTDTCDFISTGTGLYIGGSTGNVNWLFFTTTAFDQCTNDGADLYTNGGGIHGITFTSCWFSTNGGDGMFIDGSGIDGIRIIGSMVYQNGYHGIAITDAHNINIANCGITGNSVYNHYSYQAIQLNSVNTIVIEGNNLGAEAGITNYQGYGISLGSSTAQATITGNSLEGNHYDGIFVASSPTGCIIHDNYGFNTEAKGTTTNTTINSITVNTGLASTVTQFICSFSDIGGANGISGYSWTAAGAVVTVTIYGNATNFPATIGCYWAAYYEP